MDSIICAKFDRIYRIIWIFVSPVSGRNREFTIRCAEQVIRPILFFNLSELVIYKNGSIFGNFAADFSPFDGCYFRVSSGNPEKILYILLILSK